MSGLSLSVGFATHDKTMAVVWSAPQGIEDLISITAVYDKAGRNIGDALFYACYAHETLLQMPAAFSGYRKAHFMSCVF